MRVPNWDIALGQYIDGLRRQPFAWGVHDCMTFTNGAHRAQTGEGFADDWCGSAKNAHWTKKFHDKKLEEMGFRSGVEAMDSRLERYDGIPPRGSIVAVRTGNLCTGYALGVCLGAKAAFVARLGLVFVSIGQIEKAWLVK